MTNDNSGNEERVMSRLLQFSPTHSLMAATRPSSPSKGRPLSDVGAPSSGYGIGVQSIELWFSSSPLYDRVLIPHVRPVSDPSYTASGRVRSYTIPPKSGDNPSDEDSSSDEDFYGDSGSDGELSDSDESYTEMINEWNRQHPSRMIISAGVV